MNDFLASGVAILSAKFLTILASLTMAVFSVLVDAKRHSPASAFLAIIVGTVTGVIAASAIVSIMGWPEQAGYGVASVAAISSNNLIKWLLRVSNDPLSALNKWRGK